jgi:hypothetical protein
MKNDIHLLPYLAYFFLEREMFHKNVVEKMKTLIFCPVTFFFEKRAVYEIKLKNIVERGEGSLQMIIWRMRIACWIPKSTSTHTKLV